MNVLDLLKNGIWVIEDATHQGISIHMEDNQSYWISAWAENWDDIWSWQADITPEELQEVIANPANARKLLMTTRKWYVSPPFSVPKSAYFKEGKLSYDDGFQDYGTGGKSA